MHNNEQKEMILSTPEDIYNFIFEKTNTNFKLCNNSWVAYYLRIKF